MLDSASATRLHRRTHSHTAWDAQQQQQQQLSASSCAWGAPCAAGPSCASCAWTTSARPPARVLRGGGSTSADWPALATSNAHANTSNQQRTQQRRDSAALAPHLQLVEALLARRLQLWVCEQLLREACLALPRAQASTIVVKRVINHRANLVQGARAALDERAHKHSGSASVSGRSRQAALLQLLAEQMRRRCSSKRHMQPQCSAGAAPGT